MTSTLIVRRLLHTHGRLVTDAGEHGEKVPVPHGRPQESPPQRSVLYIENLPPIIVGQPPRDSPLE
jgi:hypothetical protein